MAPPQVNLNEKPPAETSEDPLPEKPDAPSSEDVIVTVDRRRPMISAEQRRQRKRCRIICCTSLSFLLVLMLALGTACIVYRMKHKKKEWRAWCGTKEAERLPEHVTVNHEHKLIYVKPEHQDKEGGMEVLHEYNRHFVAFKDTKAKKCYIDRLDETFEEGYARWQGYEEEVHRHNHTMRVFEQKIDVEVVRHIADIHIFAHCGKREFEYHWIKEVTIEEIHKHPTHTYIKV